MTMKVKYADYEVKIYDNEINVCRLLSKTYIKKCKEKRFWVSNTLKPAEELPGPFFLALHPTRVLNWDPEPHAVRMLRFTWTQTTLIQPLAVTNLAHTNEFHVSISGDIKLP